MKRLTLLTATCVLTAVVFIGFTLNCQPVFAAKAKILRLVVPSPPGDWPLTYLNEELAKRFNARTGGTYIIEVHAGGALAKLPEYFDALRVGAVEMTCAPWGMFSFLDPRLGAIEIPFLFHTSPAASAACKELTVVYDELLQQKFNAKGLSLYNPGGMQMVSTKPIKTLEDMQGLLVGAISPPLSALMKELGASPVTIMWTDLYESLQKKVITAAMQGAHGAIVMGLMDPCKYFTVAYFVSGWNGFGINLDTWKAMPENIQKILQEETTTSAQWMNQTVDGELAERDLAVLKEKNVEVYYMPKQERERMMKKVEPFVAKQIESMGDFGKRVKQIADEVNARVPYTERGLF